MRHLKRVVILCHKCHDAAGEFQVLATRLLFRDEEAWEGSNTLFYMEIHVIVFEVGKRCVLRLVLSLVEVKLIGQMKWSTARICCLSVDENCTSTDCIDIRTDVWMRAIHPLSGISTVQILSVEMG